MEKMENKENFEQIAGLNFKKWNDALLSHKTEEVVKLYSKNATFLPTLSPEFEKGKEGAGKYFPHFLEKNPAGKITEQEVQPLGPEIYLHSGKYNFEVGPEDDRREVKARFSYVWNKENGEWKILHHHSSVLPE